MATLNSLLLARRLDPIIEFQTLTGTGSYTLPTTGIDAGQVVIVSSSGLFDLVIRSSNASALTIANSANMDATIQNGTCTLLALQDTPTTPAHWRVVEVSEVYLHATTIDNTSASPIGVEFSVSRYNRTITISTKTGAVSITKANTSNPVWTTALPTRFIHTGANGTRTGTQIRNNGTDEMGNFSIQTDGKASYLRSGEAAWTVAAGLILYGVTVSYSQPF